MNKQNDGDVDQPLYRRASVSADLTVQQERAGNHRLHDDEMYASSTRLNFPSNAAGNTVECRPRMALAAITPPRCGDAAAGSHRGTNAAECPQNHLQRRWLPRDGNENARGWRTSGAGTRNSHGDRSGMYIKRSTTRQPRNGAWACARGSRDFPPHRGDHSSPVNANAICDQIDRGPNSHTTAHIGK